MIVPFREEQNLDPSQTWLLFESEFALGNFEDASALLQSVTVETAGEVEFLQLIRAEISLLEEDYDEVASTFSILAESQNTEVRIVARMGKALARLGQGRIESGIKDAHQSVEIWFREGEQQLFPGHRAFVAQIGDHRLFHDFSFCRNLKEKLSGCESKSAEIPLKLIQYQFDRNPSHPRLTEGQIRELKGLGKFFVFDLDLAFLLVRQGRVMEAIEAYLLSLIHI